ncbi:MAG: GspH/FimT family pseudopilin [Gammaproteobacteria bacterium]|nr:GspH/FimT family pseudopilin [Gammaproteobacteria bacterium]
MGRPGIRKRHRPLLAPSKARPAGCCKGLTLVEVLTTLAVAGILVTAASGGATQLVEQHHAGAAVNQMLGAIRFARHAAVAQRSFVTLCPRSGTLCGRRNTWHNGALVFLDRDANGRFDGSDVVLRRMPPLRDGDRFYWRSFRNRAYLMIRPNGLTDWQNGNILYCPQSGDPRFARQIVINAQARARHARDSDGDGIVEDARGRAVKCP